MQLKISHWGKNQLDSYFDRIYGSVQKYGVIPSEDIIEVRMMVEKLKAPVVLSDEETFAYERAFEESVAASLLALLVTVLTLAGKIPFEKYHMTLLLDVILVVMGVLMIALIDIKQFLPFSILIMLGAVFVIIAWFADENNKNKSWKQVMSEEFRLPPLIDVLLVVSIIVNLVKEVTDIPLFVSYTILALLAIDFIRQIKKLKNHEILWI